MALARTAGAGTVPPSPTGLIPPGGGERYVGVALGDGWDLRRRGGGSPSREPGLGLAIVGAPAASS